MSEFKNFRNPDEEVFVNSTTGHCAVIGKNYVPVHKSLWGEAYSKGCIPEDVKNNTLATKEFVKEQKELMQEKEQEKRNLHKKKLQDIYDSPNGFVTEDGDLIIREAIKKLGPLKAIYINELWEEVVSENS